jgi:hypothetical protein
VHGTHSHNYAPLDSFLRTRIRYRDGAKTRTVDVHAALMDHLAEHFPERMNQFPQSQAATVHLFRFLGYRHVKSSRQLFLDLELLPAPEPPGPSAVDPWPWKKA